MDNLTQHTRMSTPFQSLILIDVRVQPSTITLPWTGFAQGRTITIKDVAGMASKNPITINAYTPLKTETIRHPANIFDNGQNTIKITQDYGYVVLYPNDLVWGVIGGTTQINTITTGQGVFQSTIQTPSLSFVDRSNTASTANMFLSSGVLYLGSSIVGSGGGGRGSTGVTGVTGVRGATGVTGVTGVFSSTIRSSLYPSTTNTYNLGAPSTIFRNIYTSSLTSFSISFKDVVTGLQANLYMSNNSLYFGTTFIASAGPRPMMTYFDGGSSSNIFLIQPLFDGGTAGNNSAITESSVFNGGSAVNVYIDGPILECGTAMPIPATTSPMKFDGGTSTRFYPSSVFNLGTSLGDIIVRYPQEINGAYFSAGSSQNIFPSTTFFNGGSARNAIYLSSCLIFSGGVASNNFSMGPNIQFGTANPMPTTANPFAFDGGTSTNFYPSTLINLGTSIGDITVQVPQEMGVPYFNGGSATSMHVSTSLFDGGNANNAIYLSSCLTFSGGLASNDFSMGPTIQCGTALPTPATANPGSIDGGTSVNSYPSSVFRLGTSAI